MPAAAVAIADAPPATAQRRPVPLSRERMSDICNEHVARFDREDREDARAEAYVGLVAAACVAADAKRDLWAQAEAQDAIKQAIADKISASHQAALAAFQSAEAEAAAAASAETEAQGQTHAQTQAEAQAQAEPQTTDEDIVAARRQAVSKDIGILRACVVQYQAQPAAQPSAKRPRKVCCGCCCWQLSRNV